MTCNHSLLLFRGDFAVLLFVGRLVYEISSRHKSLLRILRHSLFHDCYFSYLKYKIIQKDVHGSHHDSLR